MPAAPFTALMGLLLAATTVPVRVPAGAVLVETKAVQKDVTMRATARAARLGLKAAAAECPRPFPTKQPVAVFVCTSAIGGEPVPYTVRYDVATATWEAASEVSVVAMKTVGATITAALGLDRQATVRCAGVTGTVIVRPPSLNLNCTVVAKRASRTVAVTIAQGDGRVVVAGQDRATSKVSTRP